MWRRNSNRLPQLPGPTTRQQPRVVCRSFSRPYPACLKEIHDPDEWFNGYHVMLDTGELVAVRWEQVEGLPGPCLKLNEQIQLL